MDSIVPIIILVVIIGIVILSIVLGRSNASESRRHLERLRKKGESPTYIAEYLNQKGLRNKDGKRFTAKTVIAEFAKVDIAEEMKEKIEKKKK